MHLVWSRIIDKADQRTCYGFVCKQSFHRSCFELEFEISLIHVTMMSYCITNARYLFYKEIYRVYYHMVMIKIVFVWVILKAATQNTIHLLFYSIIMWHTTISSKIQIEIQINDIDIEENVSSTPLWPFRPLICT